MQRIEDMKNFLFAAATALSLVLATNTQAAISTLDLTTGNNVAFGTANIGGTFGAVWADSQSTGTGVIDSFLRVQATGQERGFNTDANPILDAKAGNFTHSIMLSDILQVNIGSTAYRAFLLDINETNTAADRLLSLNQIQIFTAPSPGGATLQNSGLLEATATSPSLISFAGATEVFRMSSNDANFNEIMLDFNRNPGSGAGDMFLLVKSSLFGTDNSENVILYSHFGDPPSGSIGGIGGSDSSSDGVEEWAVFQGLVPGTTVFDGGSVPEPASLAIWGTLGLAGLIAARRRKLAEKTC
jgi:hypothetical protein